MLVLMSYFKTVPAATLAVSVTEEVALPTVWFVVFAQTRSSTVTACMGYSVPPSEKLSVPPGTFNASSSSVRTGPASAKPQKGMIAISKATSNAMGLRNAFMLDSPSDVDN